MAGALEEGGVAEEDAEEQELALGEQRTGAIERVRGVAVLAHERLLDGREAERVGVGGAAPCLHEERHHLGAPLHARGRCNNAGLSKQNSSGKVGLLSAW